VGSEMCIRDSHQNFGVFLEGWRDALLDVFCHGSFDALLGCMPFELAPFDVLDLKRPRTSEDYGAALLGAKKRLGRFRISL